jgi:hypothetical protein
MDKHSKNREKSLLKSLYKAVKKMRHKDAVEDVLDNNTTAEMDPDNIPKGSSSIMNKSKMQKKQDKPQEEPEEVKKSEEVISELIKNFNIISKAYKEKLEKKEQSEKPFHGYNKEKHSKEGGLSAKAREKYNREHGSDLQAPVSSKQAKKSPKKAARRKSFCARMSGVKGPTSKKGKLTPKGAALKRWDC